VTLTAKVVSQILTRPAPGRAYDCGPCAVFEALYLRSGGAFKVGNRQRRREIIALIRSRGGMGSGAVGTSLNQQVTAFRAFTPEFAALGLGPPRMRKLSGQSWSTLDSAFDAGKWALLNIRYTPIDEYHDHAISGTWCFHDDHAVVAGDKRTVAGVPSVTLVDPLHDGRWSHSPHCPSHSGYVPRGPITIPLSLLQDAVLGFHGHNKVYGGVFTAGDVVEDPDPGDNTGGGDNSAENGDLHPGYPGRADWSFYNVTKDAFFWPTLDSIEINDGRPEQLATFAGVVIDRDGSIAFENEDQIEVRFDNELIFAGDVVVPAHQMESRVGPRSWDLSAQDFTNRLEDNVIDADGNRKHKESAEARLRFIMGFGTRDVAYQDSHGDLLPTIVLPDEQVDPYDYSAMTVREALQQLADTLRCYYYVDYYLELHFFRDETIDGGYDLDDVAPDYGTSFPFWDYRYEPDSTDLHDRVWVHGAKSGAWVTDYSWTGPKGVAHQERAISDDSLKSATAIQHAGERDLKLGHRPERRITLAVAEPGLQAGQTPDLTVALWPDDSGSYKIRTVSTRAVDPHDEGGNAQLRAMIELADIKGGGGPADVINTGTRKRPPEPPEPCTGDGEMVAGPPYDRKTTSTPDSLEQTFLLTGIHVRSMVSPYRPWTWTAGGVIHYSACGGLEGSYGPGTVTEEQWFPFSFDPAEHPDWVGIVWDIPAELGVPEPHGVADATSFVVGFSGAGPGGPDLGLDEPQFQELARVPGGDGFQVHTPIEWLNGGSSGWIVIGPAWAASGDLICASDIPNWTHPDTGISYTGMTYEGFMGNGAGGSGDLGGPASITGHPIVLCEDGRTDWVGGLGRADGTNRVFALAGWGGKGLVEARVGGLILSHGIDFTTDADAGTATLAEPPQPGDFVAFRYDVQT
jgi:hypothetical protein